MKKHLVGICLLAMLFISCASGPPVRNEGGQAVILEGGSVADSLAWLEANAAAGTTYHIIVGADESILPRRLSSRGVTAVIQSDGPERVISLAGTGAMFTVDRGFTLVLGAGVTLQGSSANNAPLIIVEDRGILMMEGGSRVTDNNNTAYGDAGDGGGVFTSRERIEPPAGYIPIVNWFVPPREAAFWMLAPEGSHESGPLIRGNTARGDGGGVQAGFIFTMEAGEISNNVAHGSGGGIMMAGYWNRPRFEMSGGLLHGNSALGSGGMDGGGGVFLQRGARGLMTGGEISGNTAAGSGGGVAAVVYSIPGGHRRFTHTGGVIHGESVDELSDGVVDLIGNDVYDFASPPHLANTAARGSSIALAATQEGGRWFILTGVPLDANRGMGWGSDF